MGDGWAPSASRRVGPAPARPRREAHQVEKDPPVVFRHRVTAAGARAQRAALRLAGSVAASKLESAAAAAAAAPECAHESPET